MGSLLVCRETNRNTVLVWCVISYYGLLDPRAFQTGICCEKIEGVNQLQP